MDSKEKILIEAKLLFAQKGFAGVSMRNLAAAVDMSVAAIYHHFPDKNSLYLEMMRYAFTDKSQQLTRLWYSGESAEDKLRNFVKLMIEMLEQDPVFDRLIQREIIEADPKRMQILATDIFNNQFCYLLELIAEISPKTDTHLTAVSVLGLIKYHQEIKPLRHFWQGWKPEHEHADVIADHVLNLLLNGIQNGNNSEKK
ncbi:MAG: TetR family transcriptional regulator [Methylococcaceae bacterium]|nr:TetR family transcriptional regulator [Methylococcaceae bacterium]